MRSVWASLVLLAACNGGGGDDFPVNPGGGSGPSGGSNPGGGSGTDASSGDGGATISGRACLLTDPRRLDSCAATGAAGITVTLGATTVTVGNDDGSFTITSTGTLWSASRSDVVTSYMLLADEPHPHVIPVLTSALFESMKTQSTPNVTIAAGQGSIIANIDHNAAGVANVTATTPTATYAPFYDGDVATAWLQSGATAARGAIWIAGITVPATGSVTLTVKPTATTTLTRANLPIHDGAITYTTLVTP